MTYSSGQLIEAADYNGFVSTNSGANVNNVWSTGSTDSGWGQSALATVSAAGAITATQWASLVNTISTMASHTGTSITSRTAPVAGNTINILAALNTDLTNITANRRNAAASGTEFTGWTGTNSKTTNTTGTWTITFTNTITWASADAARYFFNAGGRIRIQVGKSSTGQTGDPEWNDLANTLCGDIFITGGTATQTIAGTNYTGTTRIGGTGTPAVLATTTGWYDLTTSDVTVYQQFADTAPYTGNFIRHNLRTAGSGTQLVITTTWSNPEGDTISGGTAASGATKGTAPCTIVTYFPPSTTFLTNSWGTPTVAATTA
jgi:hypothetical protein